MERESIVLFTDPRDITSWLDEKPSRWGKVLVARLGLRLFPIVFDAKSRSDPSEPFCKEFVLSCFSVALLLWQCVRLGGKVGGGRLVEAAERISNHASELIRDEAGELHPHAAGGVLYFSAQSVSGGNQDQSEDCIQYALRVSDKSKFQELIFASLASDAEWLERYRRPQELAFEPLWLEDVRGGLSSNTNAPVEILALFRRFSSAVSKESAPWELLLEWYLSILPSDRFAHIKSSLDNSVENKIAKLGSEFWNREPDTVVVDIEGIARRLDAASEGMDSESISEFIQRFLKERNAPATIQEVTNALGEAGLSIVSASVRGRLNELTAAQKIRRVERGVYAQNDWETDDHNDESAEYPSQLIPEQEPGVSFIPGPTARFQIADSGTVGYGDQSEIIHIREAILESLANLESACDGSNAFKFIIQIVSRYRSAIEAPVEQISIDRLYAQGVRLENAKERIEREIQNGELPEQGVDIGEALDSLISLHGPMIMGTDRGRSLVSRSRDYHQTESEVAEYKARAREFVQALDSTNDLIEPESKEILSSVVEDIGEGRHPERSTEVARTANSNLVVAMGKLITSPAGAGVSAIVALGVTNSVPGTLAAAEITALLNACWTFFLANTEMLRALAGATGGELTWVNSLLNWMSRNSDRRPN